MYRKGKPIRDKEGRIVGGAFVSKGQAGNKDITAATGRIAPDRRWFGNTRVVGQKELDGFRDAMKAASSDPYSVVLKTKSLPMGLLAEAAAAKPSRVLGNESFQSTFGSRATRKRPSLAHTDLTALAAAASESSSTYVKPAGQLSVTTVAEGEDVNRVDAKMSKEAIFDKGTSRRIWGELYKVLDCSDVVLQVLDARDPMGTRSRHVENYLKRHARHKSMIIVLNKCDLVPPWVTKKWVATLSRECPTLAFHASMTNPYGKGALIALLRQLSRLHSDKQQISVGMVGYPNVGKSSIINALKSKRVCNVAPIPGETKVWQYVTLFKRVFMVDCPGIVYDAGDTDTAKVLKSVVRAERLESPEDYAEAIMRRVRPEYLARTYTMPVDQFYTIAEDSKADKPARVEPAPGPERTTKAAADGTGPTEVDGAGDRSEWRDGELVTVTDSGKVDPHAHLRVALTDAALQVPLGMLIESVDAEGFLKALAKKTGKLLKGGEPDLPCVGRQVINDWQRGRLPWYTRPPENEIEEVPGHVARPGTAAAAAQEQGSDAEGADQSEGYGMTAALDIPEQTLADMSSAITSEMYNAQDLNDPAAVAAAAAAGAGRKRRGRADAAKAGVKRARAPVAAAATPEASAAGFDDLDV